MNCMWLGPTRVAGANEGSKGVCKFPSILYSSVWLGMLTVWILTTYTSQGIFNSNISTHSSHHQWQWCIVCRNVWIKNSLASVSCQYPDCKFPAWVPLNFIVPNLELMYTLPPISARCRLAGYVLVCVATFKGMEIFSHFFSADHLCCWRD